MTPAFAPPTTVRLGAGAVQKHIRAIFAKLDLPPQDDGIDRRVAAVLRHLRAHGGSGAGPGGAGTTT